MLKSKQWARNGQDLRQIRPSLDFLPLDSDWKWSDMKTYFLAGILLLLGTALVATQDVEGASDVVEEQFSKKVKNARVSFMYLRERPYTKFASQQSNLYVGGDVILSENETWGDPQSASFHPYTDPGQITDPSKAKVDAVILNRLHVTQPVTITIPSRTLSITVNQLHIERGASLRFYGGPAVIAVAREIIVDDGVLSFDSTNPGDVLDALNSLGLGPLRGGRVGWRIRVGERVDSRIRNELNNQGGSGVLPTSFLSGWVDAPGFGEFNASEIDAGIVMLYRHVATELKQAHLNRQRASTIKWANASTSLPEPSQDFRYKTELDSVKTAILSVRDQLDLRLLRRMVDIKTPEGISRSVAVYAKGDSLENQSEPDTATLEVQNPQSHSVGFLTKDPESVDQLRLALRLRLSADPWTVDLVRRRLSKDGEILGGIFTRCVLTATGLPPGVLKAIVNLENDLLDMDLTLNRALAGTFLAQLALPLGVPFTFRWISTEDSTISGSALTLRVSLQRNANAAEFTITDGVVRNNSSRSIRIAYAKASDRFLTFAPPLVVKPSESKELPIGQSTRQSWEIPREAVTWPDIDPSSAAVMFDIPDQNEVLQSIAVENHLSVYDQLKNRHLQKVILEVNYEVRASTGNIIKVPGERVSLAPAGGQGNSATLRFIKPQSGAVTVIVSGQAIYDIEQVALKTKRFDTSAVNIGNDMLP